MGNLKELNMFLSNTLDDLRLRRQHKTIDSLPKEMKEKYYSALKSLSEFQDDIIINYLIKKK